MRLTEDIVAHALVRAASRLVSTPACGLISITNKRRDEPRRRRPGARATPAIGFLLAFSFFATTAFAFALTPKQRQLNIDSFEYVWTAIRDKHWEIKPGGLDWQAIHDEFRPAIEKAESMEAARAVMSTMLERLHQTHFGIVPAELYRDRRSSRRFASTRDFRGGQFIGSSRRSSQRLADRQDWIYGLRPGDRKDQRSPKQIDAARSHSS
jgi:hypothetical protein